MTLWKSFLVKIFLLFGVAAFLGYVGNAATAWAFVAVCLMLWAFLWMKNAARVWQWSERFLLTDVPPTSGWWEDLVARIYLLQKTRQVQLATHTAEANELRSVIEALPDGVLTLNQYYQILWCDETAATHLGIDAKQDIGLPIINLVRHPDFIGYLHNHTTQPSGSILKILAPQPPLRVLSIQLVPYGNSQRLLLTRDISRWEKLETMRRDFIANVSHELKTPLTVVSGFIETLREHPLPAEQQAYFLTLMNEQSQRMQRLVEDLLTLSSLESSGNDAGDKIIMIAPLLAQVERNAQALSQGQHKIHFQIDAELNLRGNEQELFSVFDNLVSNAIRYTPTDGVISVQWQLLSTKPAETEAAAPAATGEYAAVFSVTDNGIGIEAQHLPRLTERFYRIDRSRSRDSGGTGLGLAIVKHALARHQATLDIKSTLGSGSTFSASFPPARWVCESRLEREIVVSK